MDRFDKEQRSRVMSQIRGKDTEPELLVRRLLFACRYSYPQQLLRHPTMTSYPNQPI
jgi:DNA mismatch endonuclease (patch repair protein)